MIYIKKPNAHIASMIQDFPLSKLRLLDRNPRRITKEQIQKLCDSLTKDPEFLQKRPVLVNHTNDRYQVYAGNQRVSAARKLGWKTIPCDIEEDLDEKTMKSRVIVDNVSFGDFDYDILSADFEIDFLQDCGITLKDMHIDLPDLPDETQNEEKEKKTNVCPDCGCEFD